jgi:hypothetical protein
VVTWPKGSSTVLRKGMSMLKEKFQTVQAEFIPLITQLQKHFLDSVFSTKLGNFFGEIFMVGTNNYIS